MYLDARGNVKACCANSTHTLGNISRSTLKELWFGPRLAQLRSALSVADYSLGCEVCRPVPPLQIHPTAPARSFDHLSPAAELEWPSQLELALSNTCNLECEMCYGELSSSIRAHREGLPPLPKVYGDSFFEELDEYLPHLQRINFIGGEPFLSREAWRIWRRLDELNLHPMCHVTTNGTVNDRRVDWLLDRFPISLTVSFDGADRETFERVRRGASFDQVVKNLDEFAEKVQRRGGGLSLAYCLSTTSWRALPDILRFGEVRGLDVCVNLVSEPARLSLWRSSADVLEEVADTWSGAAESVGAHLVRNRAVWLEHVAWARAAAVEARESHAGSVVIIGAPTSVQRMREIALQHAGGGVILQMVLDADDLILEIGDVLPLGSLGVHIEPEKFIGRPVTALLSGPIADRFGGDFSSHLEDHDSRSIRALTMLFAGSRPASVQLTSTAAGDSGSAAVISLRA